MGIYSIGVESSRLLLPGLGFYILRACLSRDSVYMEITLLTLAHDEQAFGVYIRVGVC